MSGGVDGGVLRPLCAHEISDSCGHLTRLSGNDPLFPCTLAFKWVRLLGVFSPWKRENGPDDEIQG